MMAEEYLVKHKRWIKNALVPKLIENQKLFNYKPSNENIEVKTIKIEQLSHEVTHMVSDCYFVNILIEITTKHKLRESVNSIDLREFDLVVKASPNFDAEVYRSIGLEDMFTTEITVYEHIIPRLNSLSNSAKYYYSHNEIQDAAIVLSDFTKDGWKMSKMKFNLPLDHVLAAVKLLGAFHGEMFALKLIDAETFNAIKCKLKPAKFKESETIIPIMYLWYELGIRRATASVRASTTAKRIVPESFLKRLEEIMHDACEYRTKCLKPVEPIATICHGDYLRNNLAFRYNDDGRAIEAMMFDFQGTCYTSPMIDLCTFMANSTGHEVRDKHFTEIFATYHDSLVENFLAATKWNEDDIPDFLKYDRLLEEYARYLPYGLNVASSFLQILHTNLRASSDLTIPEIAQIILSLGGEPVDEELRCLVVDIYRLYEQLNLEL